MRAVDPLAATHGLPGSLRIAIAAKTLESIGRYVGPIVGTYGSVRGLTGAVLVDTSDRPVKDEAPLWAHPQTREFEARLFPVRQVWVHVDYNRYRGAYGKLGMPPVPAGHFLDHIQNRKAIRLRDYSHPYIRLCPVSSQVNTSGGVDSGAEGMERAHLRSAQQGNAAAIGAIQRAKLPEIVYADPVDITKMLNIVPGTGTLDGVRDTLALYYP